ncbi:unnamed protein product [Clonostachys solani]|uniref:Uncharacterized protein n=1 Tax=Clonostachys solani TaxID=160281 RepID=A0A9P0EGD7_9HYPO|nr:unnamed protein product [Clonostachys solani]
MPGPEYPRSSENMVLIWGAAGTGKSAFVQRACYDVFPPELDPFDGEGDRKLAVVDGESRALWIFCVSNMAATGMVESFIRRSDMFVLAYSVGSDDSFFQMNRAYYLIREVRGLLGSEHVPIIIIGNKCDLPSTRRALPGGRRRGYGSSSHDDVRVVSYEEGACLAEQLGCPFFETSAKENINVEQTFNELIRAHNRLGDLRTETKRRSCRHFTTYVYNAHAAYGCRRGERTVAKGH